MRSFETRPRSSSPPSKPVERSRPSRERFSEPLLANLELISCMTMSFEDVSSSNQKLTKSAKRIRKKVSKLRLNVDDDTGSFIKVLQCHSESSYDRKHFSQQFIFNKIRKSEKSSPRSEGGKLRLKLTIRAPTGPEKFKKPEFSFRNLDSFSFAQDPQPSGVENHIGQPLPRRDAHSLRADVNPFEDCSTLSFVSFGNFWSPSYRFRISEMHYFRRIYCISIVIMVNNSFFCLDLC